MAAYDSDRKGADHGSNIPYIQRERMGRTGEHLVTAATMLGVLAGKWIGKGMLVVSR